ncbi:IS66 family insertion sequence element accessory protein TnpB [Candidatus Tisiphia endosymbiont of Parasteatoda lunata]|uniref:IS66 family insertion sequence element accessory protein TnpB n=1 Tax=Candidatus Tisiphia endosymbiont of Parasteatoda lunata TaxID=3066275 RepID=UPI00313EA570
MLQLTPASVIFVATIAIDFRKGIDGLIAVCRQKLSSDPLNGSLFLLSLSYSLCKLQRKQ